MRTQRHQVRRQIIDVTVPDRDLGIRLHEELSGIQCRGLETLIDRCCTEMSTPDRVHRLGRVEVDLGRLSLDNLEQELLEKLYPLLREALADKIREEDVLAAMLGEDPATSARIELVSLFCRTGTLPFWADVSRPHVVDEAVEVLLARNSSALAGLVRELSREQRALERLVRQVAPERLRALFEILVDAPIPAPIERAGEAWELLIMARGVSVPAPMIWIAALQTVCRGENRGQESVAFFREVMGRIAIGTQKSYKWLIGRMLEEIGQGQSQAVRGFERVLTTLWEELGNVLPTGKVPGTFEDAGEKVPGTFVDAGEKVPGTFVDAGEKVPGAFEKVPTTFAENVPTTFVDGRPSPGFSDTGGTPNSPSRAAQTTGSPPPAPEKLGQSPQFVDDGQVPKVPTTFLNIHDPHESRSEPEFFGAGGGAPLFEPAQRASLGGTASAEKPGSDRRPLLAQRVRDEKVQVPKVPGTFGEGSPSSLVPSEVESRGAPSSLVPSEVESRGASSSLVPSEVESRGLPSSLVPSRVESRGSPSSLVPSKVESRRGSPSSLVPSRVESRGSPSSPVPSKVVSRGSPNSLVPSKVVSTPSQNTSVRSNTAPTRRNSHVDPDEVYLDTSGLVLLWPFLATFFDRLELLLENRTFRSPAARCRAVYLLQHLATADLDPPEYRLPLAKILCGMPLDDVFDPGPELTPIEAAESDDVLAAILAHAKNLGELTSQDFRDGFLLRRGILCTRDDSWLLRVERAPYDLALDRLPWSLRWIRLPWMEAPIAVEWLR